VSARTLELFHRIADPASAKVRRYVVDFSLEDRLRFRNLTYPEVEADFIARGGTAVPAVWDGEVLVQGAEACIARLSRLVDLGRSG
jgi:hypothetical protein